MTNVIINDSKSIRYKLLLIFMGMILAPSFVQAQDHHSTSVKTKFNVDRYVKLPYTEKADTFKTEQPKVVVIIDTIIRNDNLLGDHVMIDIHMTTPWEKAMKPANHKTIIFSLFSPLVLVLPHIAAGKEKQRGRLSITNIQVKNVSDSIQLSFNCPANQFAIRKKERVIVTPVISDGSNHMSFSPFVIVGKKGKTPFIRSTNYERDMEVVGYQQILAYHANIKYEEWIKGNALTFESSTRLCTKQAMLTTAIVDGKILQDPDVEIVEIIKEIEPVLTTADKLAKDYGFLANISQKSEFNEKDRDKYVSILFRSGSSVILPDYQNNGRNLELLVGTINQINQIDQSPDSRVSDILIIGYASPEGDYRVNLDFGEARAIALRKYLIQNTKVSTESFKMINGGVDWFGLHQIVNESDIPEKNEVLKIIDSTSIKANKEKQDRRIELMRLKGGVTYRYMLKKIFPKLRSGT